MRRISRDEYLGHGPLFPFRLDSRGDVANAEGAENLRGCVRLLAGTRPGEIRWNQAFGLDLTPLVHATGGEALEEDARRRVFLGFQQEPRAELIDVQAAKYPDGRVEIDASYRPVGSWPEEGGVVFTETMTP